MFSQGIYLILICKYISYYIWNIIYIYIYVNDKLTICLIFFYRFNTKSGQRALGSAELLETSGAVRQEAVQLLNKVADEFEQVIQYIYIYSI